MPSRKHGALGCKVSGCNGLHDAAGYCRPHYARWRRHGDPIAGRATYRGEPLAWLLDAITQETDECIVWPFDTGRYGYGAVTVAGKKLRATRYVCELRYGPPSPGQVAAHAPLVCHNPRCINPRHLRWATQQENVSDSFADGTAPVGSRHGHARLVEGDIRAIRAAADRGESRASIARRFGLAPSTVTGIVLRKSWRSVK